MNAGPFEPGTSDPVQVEPVEGGVVVTGPPTRAPGLDLAKAEAWWKTAQKLDEVSKPTGMTVDPGALLAAAASGAAAGAAVPGVGAVAGAIIMVGVYIVRQWFAGQANNSQWANAGPGVHYWFTNYAPQGFMSYVEDNDVRSVFGSVQESAKALLMWWATNESLVMTYNNTSYAGRYAMDYVRDASGITTEGEAGVAALTAWAEQFYGNLGVDWSATNADWSVNGRQETLWMKNRSFVSQGDDASGTFSSGSAGIVLGIVAAGALALAASKSKRNG
jgi:hypothetical protein